MRQNDEGEASSQQRQAAKSFGWISLEGIGVSGLLFIVVILMGRLLTPQQFGLVALALSVVTPLTAIVESLFYEATIHARTLTDRHVDTAFTVTLVLGLGAAASCWGIGFLLAWLCGTHELILLTGAVGTTLVFSGITGVPVACLRRSLDFKSLALRSILGRGLGALGGLFAAWRGLGEWAFVVQQVLTYGLGMLVIVGALPRFPRLRFHMPEFREFMKFGGPAVATVTTHHLDARIYSLLVGYLFGTVTLGYLNMAFRLVDGIRDMLHQATYHLALPLLSQRRDDKPGLLRGYVRAARMLSTLMVPLFAAVAVLVPDLIRLSVGPQWLPATPIIVYVALAACLFFMVSLAPIVFGTLRRPEISTLINAIGMAAGVIALMLVMQWPGFIWSLRMILIFGLSSLLLWRIGVGLADLAGISLKPALVAAAVVAVTYPLRQHLGPIHPLAALGICGPTAVLVGLGATWLLMRTTLFDMIAFAAGVLRR